MKNGDRLTGKIGKSDDKSLVIKTEFAGEVTVDWSAIQDVKSDQPLHVGLKDGKSVVGPVTTADGKIQVSTKTAGNVEVPKESIVVMRSDPEQARVGKTTASRTSRRLAGRAEHWLRLDGRQQRDQESRAGLQRSPYRLA